MSQVPTPPRQSPDANGEAIEGNGAKTGWHNKGCEWWRLIWCWLALKNLDEL